MNPLVGRKKMAPWRRFLSLTFTMSENVDSFPWNEGKCDPLCKYWISFSFLRIVFQIYLKIHSFCRLLFQIRTQERFLELLGNISFETYSRFEKCFWMKARKKFMEGNWNIICIQFLFDLKLFYFRIGFYSMWIWTYLVILPIYYGKYFSGTKEIFRVS